MSIATIDSNGHLCWDQTPINLSTKKGLLETPLHLLLHLPKLLLYQAQEHFLQLHFCIKSFVFHYQTQFFEDFFFNQRIFLVGIGVLT
jgi:hypothetical protein